MDVQAAKKLLADVAQREKNDEDLARQKEQAHKLLQGLEDRRRSIDGRRRAAMQTRASLLADISRNEALLKQLETDLPSFRRKLAEVEKEIQVHETAIAEVDDLLRPA